MDTNTLQYRATQKKRYIAFCMQDGLQRSKFNFSQMFQNQNFEPVSPAHLTVTHSELERPQKCQNMRTDMQPFLY